MKRTIQNRIFIFCTLILFFLTACGEKEAEEKIRPVKIEVVGNLEKEEGVYEYPSTLESNQESKLAFLISGKIESILVSKGDFVKKGQILAQLEKRDYEWNSEANQQKWLAAQANAQNAKLQFERIKVLYENNAIAKKDFDMAQAQYKSAIAAEKANQMLFSHAAKQVDDTNLRAPYDGFISNRFLEVASVVNAGTPVFAISSEEISEVKIQVSNKDLDLFKKGENFIWVPDDEKGISYSLTLKTIGQTPDLTKMTYPIIFTLQSGETNSSLRSGMTGTVRFVFNKKEISKISIPMTALFEENGSYVYVLGDNNLVVKRKVELGDLTNDGRILILQGLQEGEKVIVAGVSTLYEGEKVRELPRESIDKVGKVL